MKRAVDNRVFMDAIVIYYIVRVLLPFLLEMADQWQRDIKLKDFPSPENIEKLALVKLRLALWWFIMTIFLLWNHFPFIIIENTTNGMKYTTFASEIIKTKNWKLTQEIKVNTKSFWLSCRCVEFSLCWNRFPDYVKSDSVGTQENAKQTSEDKAKSTQMETQLF